MTPKEIEEFKEHLTPEQLEIYEQAKLFWRSPAGMKAIRESLIHARIG